MTTQEMEKALDEMRIDSAKKNKKGMAFMIASIFIWSGILVIQRMSLPLGYRNAYTWYAVACLMPLALLMTRLLKIGFANKENPINKLGLTITLMQILYVFIVCWAFYEAQDKMVMLLAMVFGGHLLPFGWLYKSKSYMVSAIIVTLGSLITGCIFEPWVVALGMIFHQIIFVLCLTWENKKLFRN